jgi:nucleoid-associated protein YgaU
MKKLNFLLIMSLLSLIACSSNNESTEADEGQEISEESSDDTSEFEADDESAEASESTGSDDIIAADESIEEGSDTELVSEDVPSSSVNAPVVGGGFGGKAGEYKVQAGDTMMLVAFKIYGDYSKWRSIARLNPGASSKGLSAGTVLKYDVPSTPFVWNPRGNPHLIKSGDTLGAISKDKYGTPAKWKYIFDNNKPMIKNPNLIFSGFTLYWLAERDLASQK